MPRHARRAGFALAALLLVACGRSPAAPAPTQVIRPIQVDAVQVLVEGSQVSARVHGVIGDGCTELAGVTITREDTSVSITIRSQRPADAICTQIARLYDEVVRIPGEFAPGHYVLRVNSIETAFDVPWSL
jgi:hypothetical protein